MNSSLISSSSFEDSSYFSEEGEDEIEDYMSESELKSGMS